MNPSKLFELFDKARQTLKYPSLTIPLDHIRIIKISLGTNNGAIWVSNGLGRNHPDNKLYGKFTLEKFTPYLNETSELIPILKELCEDPIKFGALHSQKYKHCCFCNTELTSKASLFVGYGPICADKWGLPWGEYKDESLENL